MQANDIAELNTYLQRLYGDRYAGLTAEMGLLWYEDLKPFPFDLARHAVKRWAREHLPHQAPTLEQLVTLMEDLQTERRRQQAQQLRSCAEDITRDPEPGLLKEEVHALIASVWPDHEIEQMALLKEEEIDVKRLQLRHQARQLRMQVSGEDA